VEHLRSGASAFGRRGLQACDESLFLFVGFGRWEKVCMKMSFPQAVQLGGPNAPPKFSTKQKR